ncbi:DUF742 domain-containing protein [Nonomuraea roseoviolacea subsp. roseoviolacea]|uniref:DUF742 domain-containing protein n=1 Tax=Nonomuraea roseoviolacea subsp. carminata TaxID=160689 RepID=A0ABT1K0B3_9ACTN|nr:DUF742 domain-containing protein [Nonomuraea roseoviolacea]MCP2347032.1 hypothetical protein [Nonomuraea roseoviolacea subsp. carminata]
MSREPEWVDEEAGPVVRPYAVARGRTRSSAPEIDLLASVVASGLPVPAKAETELGAQHRRLIATVAAQARPVVELAAELELPVGVVRVLLGDLLHYGLVSVRPPLAKSTGATENLLREVINGLRAL